MCIGLSFLGTGNYSKTNYVYNQLSFETKYFPEAFVDFFKIKTLFLFVTDKAEETHKSSFKCNSEVKYIRIPEGKSEQELWNIFDIVSDVIENDMDVYVDITHGFRSLPFLILPILHFVNVTKNVIIKNIVYGAYEARDHDLNQTPVFDLSYFNDMIDWMNTVDSFIQTGNASMLKDKLTLIHKNSYLTNTLYQSKKLGTLGKDINDLSKALNLNRIHETLELTNKISSNIANIKIDVEKIPEAKPLSHFFHIIENRIKDFSSSESSIYSNESLNVQRNLLDYYIKTNQFVQCITLCRELIITKICISLQFAYSDFKKREEVAIKLGNLIHENKKYTDKSLKNICKLWSDVSNIRNDIDHSGMRANPIRLNKAIDRISELKTMTCNFIMQDLDTTIEDIFKVNIEK